MKSLAIDIHSLKKSFGNHHVLKDVDLAVPTGCIFALLGPNGAGKTTLINILTTLVAPDAGKVCIAGHDILTEKEAVKRSISLTGQYAAVDEILTADENLRMMGRLFGLTSAEAKERAVELLEQFGLTGAARKPLKTFSGGMRRRIDLAVSIIVKRPVLFLDEPTTGLDTASRRALWDIILDLKAKGLTIFLTTQYLDEADRLADDIAFISDGRIAARGTAAELKSRISSDVVELRNADDALIQEIPTDGTIGTLKHILDNLTDSVSPATRVTIRRPSMDDVFLAVTQTEREVSGR